VSDVLELANHLRELDDEALISLCRQSLAQAGSAKDFFDLAEHLLQPKALDAWLATQNADKLRALIGDDSIESSDPLFSVLKKRTSNASDALAIKIGSALSNSRALNSIGPKSVGQEPTTRASGKRAAADAGIRAFLSVQALTEFVIDLEHRYLREVAKSGLALPDVKRFGLHLGLPLEQVRELWEIARINDLGVTKDSRWLLGDGAISWLRASHLERWQIAVHRWRALISETACTELAAELKQAGERTFFDILTAIYPLADSGAGSKVERLCVYAELVGLTSDGLVQPWMRAALVGDVNKAATEIKGHMPVLQNRIILQNDLSIITPGPLVETADDRLREFAQAESIGLASHFRLTPLSISFALERGHALEEISQSLVELSDKPLPQPVDYLLKDVFRRFGRIKVVVDESGGGSYVKLSDATLALELANDLRHRIISLRQIDAKTLYSKYAADVVYFTLRDYGHLAVRANQDDSIISPERLNSQSESAIAVDPIKNLVSRLREADSDSAVGEGEMMLRQLQLAIKNKVSISVTYVGKDGTEHRFVLEPVAISNGRLRSKDKKADIERTLPLSNIVKLDLV
jgi:hypothetical protein